MIYRASTCVWDDDIGSYVITMVTDKAEKSVYCETLSLIAKVLGHRNIAKLVTAIEFDLLLLPEDSEFYELTSKSFNNDTLRVLATTNKLATCNIINMLLTLNTYKYSKVFDLTDPEIPVDNAEELLSFAGFNMNQLATRKVASYNAVKSSVVNNDLMKMAIYLTAAHKI